MVYTLQSEGTGLIMTLDRVELRIATRVVSIDGGQQVRAHLNTLGIHVGDEITVVERAPFRGPVLVEIHGSRVALGRGIAAKVTVGTVVRQAELG